VEGSRRVALAVALSGILGSGCPTLHLPGSTEPPELDSPRTVSVKIQYRQPNGCVNTSGGCEGSVVFFGTWMRPGGEFPLTQDPYSHVWSGVAYAVPVNFPPRDVPYEVRVHDPYLRESTTGGFSAQRLMVGSETIVRIELPGAYDEHGLIYIDDNGLGRTP